MLNTTIQVCLPSHLCGNFASWDKDDEKNDNCLICFIINNGKLNKFPSTRAPITTKKSISRSTGVGGFISPQNANLRH